MVEVLFFSLSISIDAFGYSLGFGSKNIRVGKGQFLILNLINTLILSLFLSLFSNFDYLFKNPIVEKISPIIMAIFGVCYVISAFLSKFKSNKSIKLKQDKINFNYNLNYFKPLDLLLLFSIFIFENAFSTFIFYTNFKDVILFVLSNFIFHYLFFIIGFDVGRKIAKKIDQNSSFLSGYIFLWLAFIELFF